MFNRKYSTSSTECKTQKHKATCVDELPKTYCINYVTYGHSKYVKMHLCMQVKRYGVFHTSYHTSGAHLTLSNMLSGKILYGQALLPPSTNKTNPHFKLEWRKRSRMIENPKASARIVANSASANFIFQMQLPNIKYPPGNEHIPYQSTFEDDFCFPNVGYVGSLAGFILERLLRSIQTVEKTTIHVALWSKTSRTTPPSKRSYWPHPFRRWKTSISFYDVLFSRAIFNFNGEWTKNRNINWPPN